MSEPNIIAGVSSARLWVMRAMYALMAVGIGLNMWPEIIRHPLSMPRMTGVALANLGTIGLLALIGLRYPLQMIPLLLYELTWKIVWLIGFALPLWRYGSLDAATQRSVYEIGAGLILLLVIPWGYVVDQYVRKPAERAQRA